MAGEISGMGNPERFGLQEINTFKEIMPIGEQTIGESKDFWDKLFEKDIFDIERMPEAGLSGLDKELSNYFDDLHKYSEYPETIPEKPFEASDLEKISPEENAKMREEFMDRKPELKREWEEQNGRPWPKYEQDVYSANGKLIRKAGSDYDAHHIQPLGMGGKNEASNITPLSAEVHYDKQGIHAPESVYSKIDKMLGGLE